MTHSLYCYLIAKGGPLSLRLMSFSPVLNEEAFNFVMAAAGVIGQHIDEQQKSTRTPSFKRGLGKWLRLQTKKKNLRVQ